MTPRFITTISKIEPKPLYRAVRESVQIGQQPHGPNNLNRCQEWGNPQVPILSVAGRDERWETEVGKDNPRPAWTSTTLDKVRKGSLKRVKLLPEDWGPEPGGEVDVDVVGGEEEGGPTPRDNHTTETAPGEDVWGSGGGCPPIGPRVAPLPRNRETMNPAPLKRLRENGPQHPQKTSPMNKTVEKTEVEIVVEDVGVVGEVAGAAVIDEK